MEAFESSFTDVQQTRNVFCLGIRNSEYLPFNLIIHSITQQNTEQINRF